jgi:hypothetical protein
VGNEGWMRSIGLLTWSVPGGSGVLRDGCDRSSVCDVHGTGGKDAIVCLLRHHHKPVVILCFPSSTDRSMAGAPPLSPLLSLLGILSHTSTQPPWAPSSSPLSSHTHTQSHTHTHTHTYTHTTITHPTTYLSLTHTPTLTHPHPHSHTRITQPHQAAMERLDEAEGDEEQGF